MLTPGPIPFGTLHEIEGRAIEAALRAADGNLAAAARMLDVGRKWLRAAMKRHGIRVQVVIVGGEVADAGT